MYRSVKSCVGCNNTRTDFMDSLKSVRQGCAVSPLLCSLFLDDFERILSNSDIHVIQLHLHIAELMLLMFADDMTFISVTINGLQSELNVLSDFCREYKLNVNVPKTKVVAFIRGGKLLGTERGSYNIQELDIVSGLCYVGLTFT